MPTHSCRQFVPAVRPSVLVVDADEDTRDLYRCAFETHGFRVLEARDGREALTRALAQRPAVVVTEVRLAYVDGYALCEILRRDPATMNVPVLVVSADPHPAHQQRARSAGATQVLVKPVAIDAIVEALQDVVEAAQSAQDDPAAAATGSRQLKPIT